MKSKKLILTFTLIVSIILTSFSVVYGGTNESGKVSLKQTTTVAEGSYKQGDEIEISISVSVKGMDGINMFLGVLDYNKNLLEYQGVLLNSEWSLISSDEQVYIERKDIKDSVGTICKMKFKVLKEFTETKIRLENIDAASIKGQGIHYLYENVNSPSITIKAKAVQTMQANKTEGTTQVGSNTTNKEQVTTQTGNSTTNKTQGTTQTGSSTTNKAQETTQAGNSTTNKTHVTEIPQEANNMQIGVQVTTTPQVEGMQQTNIVENIIEENTINEDVETNELTSEEVQNMIDIATAEITTNIHEEMKEQEKNIIEQICSYIAQIAQAIIENISKIFA